MTTMSQRVKNLRIAPKSICRWTQLVLHKMLLLDLSAGCRGGPGLAYLIMIITVIIGVVSEFDMPKKGCRLLKLDPFLYPQNFTRHEASPTNIIIPRKWEFDATLGPEERVFHPPPLHTTAVYWVKFATKYWHFFLLQNRQKFLSKTPTILETDLPHSQTEKRILTNSQIETWIRAVYSKSAYSASTTVSTLCHTHETTLDNDDNDTQNTTTTKTATAATIGQQTIVDGPHNAVLSSIVCIKLHARICARMKNRHVRMCA